MSLSFDKISIIHWFPELESHKCGYCKDENGSISYGMWAETMTVDDYQLLIDRGWRRSGKYCYKPVMDQTCCPQYTIRCEALNFKPSKSQKKVIKKVNKYLNTDCNIKDSEVQKGKAENTDECSENIVFKERPKSSFNYEELKSGLKSFFKTKLEIPCSSITADSGSSTSLQNNISYDMEIENQTKCSKDNRVSITKVVKQGVGADPNKPPSKKAKLLRLEKKQQKQQSIGATSSSNSINMNSEKSLEDFLGEISSEPKHKLKTDLVSTLAPEGDLEQTVQIEFELYYKYQTIVHNDPPEKVTLQSFTRFLISSPLKLKKQSSKFVGYGSYHQQYWLDDKLIAVGVIDILPKCISSVYFFYDPDYRNLTLGTYGSLRELEFTRSLHKIVPSIEYYYMGFYIHSCQKMKYKGKLVGSKLLCPKTYVWFPFDECITKLDKKKYCRLNDDPEAVDEDDCNMRDINSIKILQNYRYFSFENYKYRNKCLEEFQNIGSLIGKTCIKNILVVSSD